MHLIRNILRYVAVKDGNAMAAATRLIYMPPPVQAVQDARDELRASQWYNKYSTIVPV